MREAVEVESARRLYALVMYLPPSAVVRLLQPEQSDERRQRTSNPAEIQSFLGGFVKGG